MEPSARAVVCVLVDNVKTRDSLLTSVALLAFIGAILSATDAVAEPGKGHTRIIRPSDSKGADHGVADTALGADAVHGPPPAGEEIVFEVRHSNYAWGRTSQGFFINARGEVKQFDYFDVPRQPRYPPQLPPEPLHIDLLKSFGAHPKTVSIVPETELAAQRALVPAARDAPLVCGGACNDAGGLSFDAWVMDNMGVYSQIQLGTDGDIACRSLSPAAGRILDWLATVTKTQDPRFCQLPARECKQAPCAGGRECFSVTYCESVPDCDWCKDHVCVEGPDGKKHCTEGGYRCGAREGCVSKCGNICPGGPADCRQGAGGALTCRH